LTWQGTSLAIGTRSFAFLGSLHFWKRLALHPIALWTSHDIPWVYLVMSTGSRFWISIGAPWLFEGYNNGLPMQCHNLKSLELPTMTSLTWKMAQSLVFAAFTF
jgi:hypothetical protein